MDNLEKEAKLMDETYRKKIENGEYEFSNFASNKKFFKSLNFKKNYKILEIGSGTGYFLGYLYNKGFHNVHGCDISRVVISYAKKKNKNIKYCLVTSDKLPFKSNYFDAALSLDTVEHLPHIKAHFQEVRRVLKKGGIYAFATPQKYIEVMYELIYNPHQIRNLRKGHCSSQTKFSLKKMFKQLNYTEISFKKVPYKVTRHLKNRVPKRLMFMFPLIKKIAESNIIKPTLYCVMKK